MISLTSEISRYIGEIAETTDKKGNRKLIAGCIFPPSCAAFAGHFPGMPILPAIVQLATVRHIVEQYFNVDLIPTSLTRTRFRGMVSPDQHLKITIGLETHQGKYSGRYKISDISGDPISDGRFIFEKK